MGSTNKALHLSIMDRIRAVSLCHKSAPPKVRPQIQASHQRILQVIQEQRQATEEAQSINAALACDLQRLKANEAKHSITITRFMEENARLQSELAASNASEIEPREAVRRALRAAEERHRRSNHVKADTEITGQISNPPAPQTSALRTEGGTATEYPQGSSTMKYKRWNVSINQDDAPLGAPKEYMACIWRCFGCKVCNTECIGD